VAGLKSHHKIPIKIRITVKNNTGMNNSVRDGVAGPTNATACSGLAFGL
jgi:hypothetical protein